MPPKKQYQQNRRINPVVLSKKIEKLDEKIDHLQNSISAISKSHDNHISLLANFARHDIKNAILSMDTVLSTILPTEFDEKTIGTLSTYLDVIRNTMKNFAKLVPFSSTGKFRLDDLMVAVELLARTDMQRNEIEMSFDYDRNSGVEIDLPFQIILQMLNNLIINSIKALESVPEKKMHTRAWLEEDSVSFTIEDNGAVIEPEQVEKIFEFGYSTTGGSGIGLFHARYLCDEFDGAITVDLTERAVFNKAFKITLPINAINGKDNFGNR